MKTRVVCAHMEMMETSSAENTR